MAVGTLVEVAVGVAVAGLATITPAAAYVSTASAAIIGIAAGTWLGLINTRMYTDLFRFQTSAGVILNRLETYVGYEYYDIDRTQTNALIAGVGVWF